MKIQSQWCLNSVLSWILSSNKNTTSDFGIKCRGIWTLQKKTPGGGWGGVNWNMCSIIVVLMFYYDFKGWWKVGMIQIRLGDHRMKKIRKPTIQMIQKKTRKDKTKSLKSKKKIRRTHHSLKKKKQWYFVSKRKWESKRKSKENFFLKKKKGKNNYRRHQRTSDDCRNQ